MTGTDAQRLQRLNTGAFMLLPFIAIFMLLPFAAGLQLARSRRCNTEVVHICTVLLLHEAPVNTHLRSWHTQN